MATPRDEAVRILDELAGLRPDDTAIPTYSTAAIAYSILAVADEIAELHELLERPIDRHNEVVRTASVEVR